MEPESMEVVPSEDNGNVPAEEIAPVTPSEPPQTETPTESGEPAATAEPEVQLFDLPDGRKVDAETLAKEWKENFLPDYTRKSQALAAKETPAPLQDKPASPYADPNYVPTTYQEIIDAAKVAALQEIEAKETQRVEAQKERETLVESQLTEVKSIDPTVNENALFQHAVKYGFRDLKLAHQNMKDMSEVIKKTQKTTADNIQKRNDPVSAAPGATGVRPNPSQFASSQEYLRALKASGI